MNRFEHEVEAERAKQFAKWGEQNHRDVDPVLMDRPGGCTAQRMAEEYEIPTAARAKFSEQVAANRGQTTWAHIAVEELAEAIEAAVVGTDTDLYTELTQLEAVVRQWREALVRRVGVTAFFEQAVLDTMEARGDFTLGSRVGGPTGLQQHPGMAVATAGRQEPCYCCSCRPDGAADAACRGHGFAARRPCEFHGTPGVPWDDTMGDDMLGTMPGSVQEANAAWARKKDWS